MPNEAMKLFVWDDVLTDYTSGIMFALAPSVEEARAMLAEKIYRVDHEDLLKAPIVYDLTSPVCRAVCGGG